MKTVSTLLALLCLYSSLCLALPSEPKVARLCMRCHGPAGKSTHPSYPKLAGQHHGYLSKQLTEFKKGSQGSRFQPLMSTIALALTETEIEQLADFFSQQQPLKGYANKANLDLGQRLYQGGNRAKNIVACKACHGPAGEGNAAARFPALAGQHAAYVLRQLQAFQLQKRSNDPDEIMREIAYSLTTVEMSAVANYISGLHH